MNKQEILDTALAQLMLKLEETDQQLSRINADIASDTKSSMGDKYETSREMATMELNKLSVVRQKIKEDVAILKSLNLNVKSPVIGNGSLIETDKGTFFIGAPIGKVKIENREVMMISGASPFGKMLVGKDTQISKFEVNGVSYQVDSVH